MHRPFFPDPIFGWVFLAAIMVLAGIASYLDLRRMVVPKWLSLSCLALGVLFTIVRGTLLGADGIRVFFFEPNGALLGAADGLLFAVSGAGLGFAVYFLLWVLGTCGGGDVKLFTAISAWLGPQYVIYVFALSLVVVAIFLIVKILRGGLSTGSIQRTLKKRQKGPSTDAAGNFKAAKMRLTFSLPLSVATLLVLLWFCRYDLQLAERPEPVDQPKEQARAY